MLKKETEGNATDSGNLQDEAEGKAADSVMFVEETDDKLQELPDEFKVPSRWDKTLGDDKETVDGF